MLGRPLVFYPIMAAKQAKLLDAIYLSTDSEEIKEVARGLGVQVIDRPAQLSQDNSELVDAILHAMKVIGRPIEILVTMHCNCAVHRPGLVDECIEKLESDPEADSCVSGITARSVHPFRTRRVAPDGTLHPWMDAPPQTSSNRQALEGCFVLDGGARAMRVARCFPPHGKPPFGYLGNRILSVENTSGGDVHDVDDIILAEYHLRQMGWDSA